MFLQVRCTQCSPFKSYTYESGKIRGIYHTLTIRCQKGDPRMSLPVMFHFSFEKACVPWGLLGGGFRTYFGLPTPGGGHFPLSKNHSLTFSKPLSHFRPPPGG